MQGPGSLPGQGTRPHLLQLKILHTTPRTQRSQTHENKNSPHIILNPHKLHGTRPHRNSPQDSRSNRDNRSSLTQSKRMKKQRNHFQLNDEENSPERTNNETDLTDTDFKMEIMKTLKELRKVIDRNLLQGSPPCHGRRACVTQ